MQLEWTDLGNHEIIANAGVRKLLYPGHASIPFRVTVLTIYVTTTSGGRQHFCKDNRKNAAISERSVPLDLSCNVGQTTSPVRQVQEVLRG